MNLQARCREQFKQVLSGWQDRQAHRPTPGASSLSSWASGIHALALRSLDPRAAQQELEAIYALGQHPDGLLAGEMALPPGASGIPAAGHRPPADAGKTASEETRSRFIAPPVAAYAVGALARNAKLPLTPLLEAATRELDAIWAERLPPDTPLPVILHPREAGLARTPQFESLIDSEDDEEWDAELASLARSALACRLDPATALRAGHAFVIEDPVFCGWLLLALEELEAAWELRGQSSVALKLRVRSAMIREAVEERLWWDDEEIYCAYNRGRQEAVHVVGVGGLVPTAVRGLIEEGSAKRAIDRHLRPSGSALWTAKGLVLGPVPGGLRDESTLPPGRFVVPAAQFCPHLALVRSGRLADARVLRAQLEGLIEAHGFSDAYSPISGAPPEGAASGSASPALVLEMRASDDVA